MTIPWRISGWILDKSSLEELLEILQKQFLKELSYLIEGYKLKKLRKISGKNIYKENCWIVSEGSSWIAENIHKRVSDEILAKRSPERFFEMYICKNVCMNFWRNTRIAEKIFEENEGKFLIKSKQGVF